MPVIAGIVVVFHPELDPLSRLLGALGRQVDDLVIVDNGPGSDLGAWLERLGLPRRPRYLPLRENLGIGAAQNVGILSSVERGATHVVLFDQDSCPGDGLVSALLRGEASLLAAGVTVGAVGPQLFDEATGSPFPFIQFRHGIKKWTSASDVPEEWIETHHLVASGTMIRASILQRVGLMREDLFLEYVDVEWGLRARSLGYRSFGIKQARMQHNLGDRRAKVLFGLKTVPLHSPLRHYYTMRNAIWMQRLPYVPTDWKVYDAVRTALGFVYFGLFTSPRTQQVGMMLRGLRDGLARRTGRYAE